MSSDAPHSHTHDHGERRAAGTPADPPPTIRLHAFGGEEAAPELLADVRRALALPATAKQRLWEVLGPSLAGSVPSEVDRQLRRFADAHKADGMLLARALKGCRTLLRQAAAIGLSPQLLAEDLTTIAGGAPDLGALLVHGYEHVNERLRMDIHRAAIAEHGKLLTGVRFRVDFLSASDQGVRLRFPAVTLTLHYREGTRNDQVTLQVLPDVMKQLHGVCEQVLGRR
jgi:hypothetical protein